MSRVLTPGLLLELAAERLGMPTPELRSGRGRPHANAVEGYLSLGSEAGLLDPRLELRVWLHEAGHLRRKHVYPPCSTRRERLALNLLGDVEVEVDASALCPGLCRRELARELVHAEFALRVNLSAPSQVQLALGRVVGRAWGVELASLPAMEGPYAAVEAILEAWRLGFVGGGGAPGRALAAILPETLGGGGGDGEDDDPAHPSAAANRLPLARALAECLEALSEAQLDALEAADARRRGNAGTSGAGGRGDGAEGDDEEDDGAEGECGPGQRVETLSGPGRPCDLTGLAVSTTPVAIRCASFPAAVLAMGRPRPDPTHVDHWANLESVLRGNRGMERSARGSRLDRRRLADAGAGNPNYVRRAAADSGPVIGLVCQRVLTLRLRGQPSQHQPGHAEVEPRLG